MRHTIHLVMLAVLATLMSCDMQAKQLDPKTNVTENPDFQNMTQVELETSMGTIVVVLYNETPQHRDNFVKLVNDGYYDGVLFHRVIKDFMIQAGDGNSKTATPHTPLGDGDPGYTIPAEFVFPKYFHKRGALAAARTPDEVNPERRSSGSQFYIVTGKVYSSSELNEMIPRFQDAKCEEIFRGLVNQNMDSIQAMQRSQDVAGLQKLQDELIQLTIQTYEKNPFRFTDEQIEAYTTIGGTPFLDTQYTVFGEVIKGIDVVDKIQNVSTNEQDRPVDGVKIISAKVIDPSNALR